MLYPIWQPMPRPPHFPDDPKLHRLLDSNFDPKVGHFRLSLRRRKARDLRKGLFGPKGLRDVPKGEGVRVFDLPNSWTLRLTYRVPPDCWSEPGDVVAEFIPPTMREEPPIGEVYPQRSLRSGDKATEVAVRTHDGILEFGFQPTAERAGPGTASP